MLSLHEILQQTKRNLS